MSFFLSILVASFSQVGFGGLYFGFLISVLVIFFSKLGFENFFHSIDSLSLFSFGISHFLVVFTGAVDLSHVDPTHLYPVLLFSNPVPGFTEFLSQLDFLSFHSLDFFSVSVILEGSLCGVFSKVFQKGFRDISSFISYFGLFAIYSRSLFFEKLLCDFFVSFLHWSLDSSHSHRAGFFSLDSRTQVGMDLS